MQANSLITLSRSVSKRMILPNSIWQLSKSLEDDFKTIEAATQGIRKKLEEHADGKKLKGAEITGWLGEIYAKMIMDGTLVPDDCDYDVKARDMHISVKARKGTSRGWQITSTIPRIKGDGCPTHLMFIQFTDNFSINRIWLFPWKYLNDSRRFVPKRVHGENRGYYVRIKPSLDIDHLIYSVDIDAH